MSGGNASIAPSTMASNRASKFFPESGSMTKRMSKIAAPAAMKSA